MTTKQVIVMRTDLGMRRGKQIAQGAHASMAVLFRPMYATVAHRVEVNSSTDAVMRLGVAPVGEQDFFIIGVDPVMRDWLMGAFTKICVRATSEEELLALYKQAEEAKIPCALITDAGATEFHGVPTVTCCAIGPAEAEAIDAITGELKLL
jgi:peptidyl-tRNA hydrolase, PTH2 family